MKDDVSTYRDRKELTEPKLLLSVSTDLTKPSVMAMKQCQGHQNWLYKAVKLSN